MSKQRADLGFGESLDDIGLNDWTPAPRTANDRPPAAVTEKAASAAGFKSREPKAAAPRPTAEIIVRRRRTGRNAQFNLKARQDTIDEFKAIADGQGLGLGEGLEWAVALMREAIAAGKPPGK